MPQSSSDKYVYFTVGILKDSQTLDSLRQDALKHHMVDHPGQLIALRLAEHYEMVPSVTMQPTIQPAVSQVTADAEEKEKSAAPGGHAVNPVNPVNPAHTVHPVHLTPAPANNPRPFTSVSASQAANSFYHQPSASSPNNNSFISQSTGRMRALRQDSDIIIPTSPNADQNADDAADYWNAL